jgi:hypothetical protein
VALVGQSDSFVPFDFGGIGITGMPRFRSSLLDAAKTDEEPAGVSATGLNVAVGIVSAGFESVTWAVVGVSGCKR